MMLSTCLRHTFFLTLPLLGIIHVLCIFFICLSSLRHPFIHLPSPYPPSVLPFSLLFFLLPLFPLLGEGLSSSRLSLHKPGSSTSSVSNLSQRRESRVSVLLNHLLPSSSYNSGLSSGPSPLNTPHNTPSLFRRSQSPSRVRCTGLGPQDIPEVVVSPPEDDDPPNSAEEDTVSPQLSRRTSSALQNLELQPLEGKYLFSLPV